jgi:hypothetical protein
VASRNDARREVIGRLIGDLGEIQARLLHLVLDEPKPAMAPSALASAVDGLESVLEHLRGLSPTGGRAAPLATAFQPLMRQLKLASRVGNTRWT